MEDNNTPNSAATRARSPYADLSGQSSSIFAAHSMAANSQASALPQNHSGGIKSNGDLLNGVTSTHFNSRPVHSKLHVILIDRRTVVRDCISHILRSSSLCLDVLGISTIKELQDASADLVLVGLERGPTHWQNLKEQLFDIKRLLPGVPIVAITDNEEPQYLREALKYGVSGIVPTTMGVQIAVAVIELALAGGHYAPSDLLAEHLTEVEDCDELPAEPVDPIKARTGPSHPVKPCVSSHCTFTFREQQILEQLKMGTQNKLIAYNLGISENTVKTHLRNIMKKLHATNRTRVAFLTQDPHSNLE
eukprot:gene17322-17513_t